MIFTSYSFYAEVLKISHTTFPDMNQLFVLI